MVKLICYLEEKSMKAGGKRNSAQEQVEILLHGLKIKAKRKDSTGFKWEHHGQLKLQIKFFSMITRMSWSITDVCLPSGVYTKKNTCGSTPENLLTWKTARKIKKSGAQSKKLSPLLWTTSSQVFVGFVQQLSLEFQRPSVKGSKANVCVELSNAIQRRE